MCLVSMFVLTSAPAVKWKSAFTARAGGFAPLNRVRVRVLYANFKKLSEKFPKKSFAGGRVRACARAGAKTSKNF